MADVNSTATRPDGHPAAPVTEISCETAASLLRNACAARAILRTVILASDAQEDGSILYADNAGTERWCPALGVVRGKLEAVREILMNTSGRMEIDFFSPLVLVEALDAALWHGNSPGPVERLDNIELVTAAQAAVDSIDDMLGECQAAGVHQSAGRKFEASQRQAGTPVA